MFYLPFDGALNDLSDTSLKVKLKSKVDFINSKSAKALFSRVVEQQVKANINP